MSVIATLMEKRDALIAESDAVIANPDSTVEELEAVSARNAEVKDIEARIATINEHEARKAAIAESRAVAGVNPVASVSVVQEERVYRPDTAGSFFLDVIGAQVRGDQMAAERLRRHAVVESRDLGVGSTAAGAFIPPVYLTDKYAGLARAGRPVADLIGSVGAPTSTTMSLPRITTGPSVAAQNGANGTVSETDTVTSSISRDTVTIAGQQDVALQALDLGQPGFDLIMFKELIAAHSAELDRQVVAGSGSSGELLGINAVSSISGVTYTDASPTAAEMYPKIAQLWSVVSSARKQADSLVWIMHPRRWAFFLNSLDSSNRPLVVPNTNGPTNSVGIGGGAVTEGAAGSLLGVPVVLDSNVPTGLGSGTNEDEILLINASDHVLYEGAINTRVLPEVNSGTLAVRLQLFSYANFFAGRYPSGIGALTGTGLAAWY